MGAAKRLIWGSVAPQLMSGASGFEGVGHFECKFQTEGGRPPTTVSVRKQSDCPIVWYQSIRCALFGFVTKHACDGQMDGRTELRLPRPR